MRKREDKRGKGAVTWPYFCLPFRRQKCLCHLPATRKGNTYFRKWPLSFFRMRQLTLLPNFAALQWCLSTRALGTPQPGCLFVVGATCVLWVSAVSMISLHPPDTSRCPSPAVLMRCVSSCCWRFGLVGRMEPLPRTPICRRNAQQRNRHLLVVRAPVS